MGYIFSYTMGLSFVVQVGNPFLGVLPGCRVDRRGPILYVEVDERRRNAEKRALLVSGKTKGPKVKLTAFGDQPPPPLTPPPSHYSHNSSTSWVA